jgi:hypothetical protein
MGLHWRALHRPVGAEHIAVARLRAQHGLAALAFVEELTRGGRHNLTLRVAARWACQHRREIQFRHSLSLNHTQYAPPVNWNHAGMLIASRTSALGAQFADPLIAKPLHK